MVDSRVLAAHKRYIGNNCVYKHIAHRKRRPFLQRNLNRALDVYEFLLSSRSGAPNDASADSTSSSTKRFLMDDRDPKWTPPLDEMVAHHASPALEISALQIRKLGLGERVKTQVTSLIPGCEWLPDPTVILRVPCVITVSIKNERDSRSLQSIRGRLYGRRDAEGRPYFDIELDRLLSLPIDDLYLPTVSSYYDKETQTTIDHWEDRVFSKHNLGFMIRCQDSDDSAKLLRLLENKGIVSYANCAESILRCETRGFPEITTDLLPITRSVKADALEGWRTVELDYGVDVSMLWRTATESALTICNKNRQASKTPQLPTPSASEDSEIMDKRHVVRYLYHEGERVRCNEMQNLKCIWCDENEPEHSTIHRLYVHYTLHHSHFDFEMEQGDEESATITISQSERITELTGSDDPKAGYHWIAPENPFDIGAYVKGDRGWVNHGQTKAGKRGKTVRAREQAESQPLAISIPAVPRRPLEEIPSLPSPPLEEFPVRDIRRNRFYHTHSKQRYHPGDMVPLAEELDGQSDPLDHTARRDLALEGLSQVQREFQSIFTEVIGNEQPGHAVFVREALVRFTRKYRERLRSSEWGAEFESRLEFLARKHFITEEVARHCLDIVASADNSTAGDEDRMDVDEEDELYKENTPGISSKGNGAPTSNGMHKNAKVCRCGEAVTTAKSKIICDRYTCKQPNWHLKCVGLTKRVEGWICPDCTASDTMLNGSALTSPKRNNWRAADTIAVS